MRRITSVHRRAFTLIELLVVIAIIAVLIGLLLPAVQKVRSAAQRSQCSNNFKQVALAFLNYESANGAFPSYFDDPWTGTYQSHMNGPTWAVKLLPYWEQQALYAKYRFDLAWDDPLNLPVTTTSLKVLLCPAVPGDRFVQRPDGTRFGTLDVRPDLGLEFNLLNSPTITAPADGTGGGAIQGWNGPNGTRVADMTDGTSQTIVVNEDAGQPQKWLRGRQVAADVSDWTNGRPLPVWGSPQHWMHFNSCDALGSADANGLIVGPYAVNGINDEEIYSFHPGGAFVAFVDGHVFFVNESIAVPVMAALVTRAGGEVVSGSEY